MFSQCVCDHLNRSLKDRKWHYRHGDKSCSVGLGIQDNFAWSCILQNVFNVYCEVNNKNPSDDTFEVFFLDLSLELYKYAKECD